MKKKILSIAMVALSLVAFNGMAQSANTDSSVKTEKVCGQKKAQCAGKKVERPGKNPYEGLTLSETQKSQLQQLDAKRKEARKQQKAAAKEQKAQLKSMTREQKAHLKAERIEARKAAKKQYLQEVKAIVGPEQYVVFLENMYVNGDQHKAKGIKSGYRKGDKNMVHGHSSKKGAYKGGKKDGKQRNGQRTAASDSRA